MANPIMAWLRGDDLKPKVVEPVPSLAIRDLPVVVRKMWLYQDQLTPALAAEAGAQIRMGTLVHGPGATEMYYRAWHHEDGNSAVYACLKYICTAAAEAQPTVYRQTEPGEQEELPDHPLQMFLKKPNPHLSARTLEYYKQWCKHVNGNAYFRKVRSASGLPVQLWPISPLRIQPVTTREDAAQGRFISWYAYKYDLSKDPELLRPEDIVHYRMGLDDKDHRLGDSPLAKLTREVLGDDAATEWQNTMLDNGGTVGMLIQVPDGSTLTTEQAEDMKNKFEERFGGRNRGRTGVLMGGAQAQPYGFNPQQMDMKSLHALPEERISAVFGSAAVIVGLGVGLEHSIYNNYHEAREAFTEQTLLPLYAFDEDTINMQVTPEFTNDQKIAVAYDVSKLRALQEDENARYKRVTEAWDKDLLTLNQSRVQLGYPPEPDGDKRKSELAPPPTPIVEEPPPDDEDEEDEEREDEKKRDPLWADKRLGRKPETYYEQATGRPDPVGQKRRQLEQLPEWLQAIVDLSEPGFEKAVDKYLDGQRRRIKRRLVG